MLASFVGGCEEFVVGTHGFRSSTGADGQVVVRLSLLLYHTALYTKVRTLSNINFRAIRIARSSRRASLPRPIRLPAVLGLCIQEEPSLWDFDSLGSYPREDYIPPFGIRCLPRARNEPLHAIMEICRLGVENNTVPI